MALLDAQPFTHIWKYVLAAIMLLIIAGAAYYRFHGLP